MALLAERFASFGLELHPEKTRLIRFSRPDDDPPQGDKQAMEELVE